MDSSVTFVTPRRSSCLRTLRTPSARYRQTFCVGIPFFAAVSGPDMGVPVSNPKQSETTARCLGAIMSKHFLEKSARSQSVSRSMSERVSWVIETPWSWYSHMSDTNGRCPCPPRVSPVVGPLSLRLLTALFADRASFRAVYSSYPSNSRHWYSCSSSWSVIVIRFLQKSGTSTRPHQNL